MIAFTLRLRLPNKSVKTHSKSPWIINGVFFLNSENKYTHIFQVKKADFVWLFARQSFCDILTLVI